MRPKTLLAAMALALVAGTAQAHVVKHYQQNASIHQLVTQAAVRHGVPVALAHGIVRAESNYRCGVRASDGLSVGIMQVRPATARSVGVHGSMTNCANSLEAGMRYLRKALARAGGDWTGAATLYNQGIGATPRSSSYARRVIALAGN